MLGLIDYGMGNLRSVTNSFQAVGASPKIVKTAAELQDCERVILPGVGSFAEGAQNLRKQGLFEPLRGWKRPLLGICLGMQLLAEKGIEGGETEGLGLIPGDVPRLDDSSVRVPHVGWNDIRLRRQDDPFIAPPLAGDYYFVHSYHFRPKDERDILADCEYGQTFAAAVGRGTVYGVQFHPEKSHAAGLEMLKNFLGLPC